ncbi:ROK family transcriptional regulator [Actinospica sp.]|uniref:ROK family transcriptional regulator n=1 Tax=Actinospica sp. TaxID=1872142 RepID=UPI002BC4AB9C|nr:ROK family transcriptional regulator [Actinospica sp.]HWG25116.1 ROK family transcriptional regulator [Actinospica sp.]
MTRTAVLAILARHGGLSRAEIAERLELSPATITTITRRLLDAGLVEEGEPRNAQTGRPSIPLELVPDSAHALGVQVAHEHVTGVLTRLDASVVDGFRHPFDPSAPDAVDVLTALIRAQLESVAERKLPLLGVGIAVPGVVEPATGTLRMSVRLGWTGMPLAARLRSALGVPVFVDNDISAVTAAERLYGRGADCADFLLVAIGQGIGLGMVLDGAPYRGAAGAAGEFGHVPILPDGPVCSCGNRGCLETQVSTESLLRRAREVGIVAPEAELEDLRAAAAGGDQRGLSLLRRSGELLGRALAGSVNLLGPERVVVIGEISMLWPYLAEAFRRALTEHLLPCVRDTEIDVRPWADDLIALGAAGIVLATPLAAPRQYVRSAA